VAVSVSVQSPSLTFSVTTTSPGAAHVKLGSFALVLLKLPEAALQAYTKRKNNQKTSSDHGPARCNRRAKRGAAAAHFKPHETCGGH
jgi:hypothetical protein